MVSFNHRLIIIWEFLNYDVHIFKNLIALKTTKKLMIMKFLIRAMQIMNHSTHHVKNELCLVTHYRRNKTTCFSYVTASRNVSYNDH